MRGKHRHDAYLVQSSQRVIGRNSRRAHAQQSPAKRSGQHRPVAVQLGRAPPPLAMIGFRQVGQLKINRERFGHTVGVFHRQVRDPLAGLRHEKTFRWGRFRCGHSRGRRLLALLNQQVAKLLHHVEQRFARLLHQHFS